MIEPIYPNTSWCGFINYLKEKLDRDMTVVETKDAMKSYIQGVPVEKYWEGLE